MSRLAVLALVSTACFGAACSSSHHANPDTGVQSDLAMMYAHDGAVIPRDLAGVDLQPDLTTPCVPSVEVCDGKDNNCNGLIDEPALGGPNQSVCDCPMPASLTIDYPDTVSAGVPSELNVTLLDSTGAPIPCDPGVIFTSSDAAAKPPLAPIRAAYGGFTYVMALVTPGTQSITATADGVTATRSGIKVVTGDHGVMPAITPVSLVAPSKLTAIPSTNTFVDDFAYDGAVTIGSTLYFFANQGQGAKLFAYDPAGGVRQLSNTNPGGPDHQWTGGVSLVGNTLYFDALNAAGCVKLYRYTPGDAMVTTPFYDLNLTACAQPATQIAHHPDTAYGALGDTTLGTGDDVYPQLFNAVGHNALVYFFAPAGTPATIQLIEYDPTTNEAFVVTDLPYQLNAASRIIGVDTQNVYFTGSDGVYTYRQGGGSPIAPNPTSTAPAIPPTTGSIFIGSTTYYLADALYSYTYGASAPVQLSSTGGTNGDLPADLVQIGQSLYFSSLDSTNTRHIYQYAIGSTTQVTAPIADPCGTGCTLASQPLGTLGTTFYFGARDANNNLKFFASAGANATPAFTVNQAPTDSPTIAAAVGSDVYVLQYSGFLGEQYSTRYPKLAAQRTPTRYGWGRPELYDVPATGAPKQVFATVAGDDDDVDASGGIKAPSQFSVVGNSLFFVARGTETSAPSFTYHLYSHTPGGGMVTTPIDSGIRIPPVLTSLVSGGALYFVADVANNVTTPQWKLFRATPGTQVTAANAITNLVSGGSDGIANLTDVSGTVLFIGTDASGNGKLYKYAAGDPVVTTAAAQSNIVPGGNDALSWNPTEIAGGDSSVAGKTLTFTSAQSSAFQYTVGTTGVVQAADALPVAGGSGDFVTQTGGMNYLFQRGVAVADGYYDAPLSLLGSFSSGGPVAYARVPQLVTSAGAGPVEYLRIGSGLYYTPVEYIRQCRTVGPAGGAVNGVFWVMAYLAGTDTCSYLTTVGADDQFNGYGFPFPAIGVTQTQWGPSATSVFQYDAASDTIYLSGASSVYKRGVQLAKLYAYKGGALTMLSPSRTGQDLSPSIALGNGNVYFTANPCGGRMDTFIMPNAYSCPRAYKYTP